MKVLLQIVILIFLPQIIMSQNNDIKVECDPKTGLCTIPEFLSETEKINWNTNTELIYIGDPMCSWCWGISPHLNALKRYCDNEKIPFTMLMGGLRPGGGDTWDNDFKNYLKHHWQEVNKRSKQPFGFELFNKDNFEYDTEPACRAVVTAKKMAPLKTMAFYELVQHYFYVKSEDPKQVEFYRPICKELKMDYEAFAAAFLSDEMKQTTHNEFKKSRSLGINSFPSIIYRKGEQLHLIGKGYAKFEDLQAVIIKLNEDN